jgi:hypothetical protein
LFYNCNTCNTGNTCGAQPMMPLGEAPGEYCGRPLIAPY